MRIRDTVAALALVAATFVAGCAVYSEDPAQGGMPTEAEMKAMMEAAATTEEHAKLAALAGTWDSEVACGPATSKGVMTMEPLLDGRVLLCRFKGDMGGMPFEGVELRGFHKEKNDHWSIWIDSMGTLYVPSHGSRAADGTISTKSDAFDYIGSTMSMEMTTKLVDADRMEGTMVIKTSGKPDMKSTMTLIRRKSVAPAPK